MRLGPRLRELTLIAIALLAGAVPAGAHEEREIGDHTVEVGWLEEPAYTGFLNAVTVRVAHGDEPVEGAELEVEVIFGKRDSDVVSQPLRLEPAFGAPGEYRASLIPTRPGTYTFHVVGTIEQGEEIDEYFSSGEGTFNDVQDPAEAQFPVKDPTLGQLAEAVQELTAQLEEGSGEPASSTRDDGPQTLAIVGIALGALALMGVSLVARRARR